MAVTLGDNLRVTVRFVVAGAKVISNHFFTQYIGLGVISDSEAIAKLEDWVQEIYDPIGDMMDSSISIGVCQVDEVAVEGVYDPDPEVNDAKVVTVRSLGTFVPAIDLLSSGDQYATQIALVGVANTDQTKVRGRKSFGGITEQWIGEAVLMATGLTKLAAGVTEWIGGPSYHDVGTEWLAGIMSQREGDFVPFNGTGSVSNILGNQVRRKMRRS